MGISINNIFSALEVQAPGKRSAAAARASRADEKKDMVALSSKAKDFQTARRALAGTPDIRSDIVNPIKSRVEAGLYDVNAQMIADKMLEGFDEPM